MWGCKYDPIGMWGCAYLYQDNVGQPRVCSISAQDGLPFRYLFENCSKLPICKRISLSNKPCWHSRMGPTVKEVRFIHRAGGCRGSRSVTRVRHGPASDSVQLRAVPLGPVCSILNGSREAKGTPEAETLKQALAKDVFIKDASGAPVNTNPETQNPKPETRNPEPETQNPKSETQNPKTENRKPNLKSKTRNQEPGARNPKPEIKIRIPTLDTPNCKPHTR